MQIPAFPKRRIRLALLLWGLGVFMWMRLEDASVGGALLAGALTAVPGVLLWAWRETGGARPSLMRLLLAGTALGALAGLATPITSAALMLLKNGSHAHVVPDYPFGVMLQVLLLAPLYAVAGALVGFGLCALAAASRKS